MIFDNNTETDRECKVTKFLSNGNCLRDNDRQTSFLISNPASDLWLQKTNRWAVSISFRHPLGELSSMTWIDYSIAVRSFDFENCWSLLLHCKEKYALWQRSIMLRCLRIKCLRHLKLSSTEPNSESIGLFWKEFNFIRCSLEIHLCLAIDLWKTWRQNICMGFEVSTSLINFRWLSVL